MGSQPCWDENKKGTVAISHDDVLRIAHSKPRGRPHVLSCSSHVCLGVTLFVIHFACFVMGVKKFDVKFFDTQSRLSNFYLSTSSHIGA